MFQIITDSTTDLPESYFKEHDIKVVNLKCIIDGVQYGVDKFLSSDEFTHQRRKDAHNISG